MDWQEKKQEAEEAPSQGQPSLPPEPPQPSTAVLPAEPWPVVELRGLALLPGEKVVQMFSPRDGLVDQVPPEGELLVMTNQRVIGFIHGDGRKTSLLTSLSELRAVALKTTGRNSKHVLQGLGLVVAGLLAYVLIGYTFFTNGGQVLGALVGGIIGLIGVMLLSRYFFWEDEGTISFQSGSWEISFPYFSQKASADAYSLVDRFFQLKLQPSADKPKVQEQKGVDTTGQGAGPGERGPGDTTS